MDTKVCNACKRDLPASAFYPRSDGKGRNLQSRCKECISSHNKKTRGPEHNAKQAEWRRSNPGRQREYWQRRKSRHGDAIKQQRRVRSRSVYRENQAWLASLKSRPCMDCGGTFPPVCMDFDHRDGAQKRFGIAEACLMSRLTLEQEIAKCDVVCSNCHRIRTQRRRDAARERAAQ